MSIYVDDMRAPYGRLIMCHMIADTLDELHAMADHIGVARKWFQNAASGPHYDIALSKRALAVSFGAQEITLRQCACMMKRWRKTGVLGAPGTAVEWVHDQTRVWMAARDDASGQGGVT